MTEPCPHEQRIVTIERRYEALLESLKKMEDKFGLIRKTKNNAEKKTTYIF